MSKKKKIIDSNQVCMDLSATIEAYTKLREEIMAPVDTACRAESYDEACIEIAAVIKSMIRETGMSRDQIVEAINEFFGWSTKDKRKCLTLAMFNNYLSKPIQYPIPAVGIAAVQHVCQSLKPISYFAELEGGKVITKHEVHELSLGKIDNLLKELHVEKKRLLGIKK